VEELGKGMESEFDHDSRAVGLHSPDRNSQIGGYHLIGFCLGQKSNDLNLARSWLGSRPRRWGSLISILEKSLQYDVGYFGGEEELTRRDILHGVNEICREIGFQDIGEGSGLENAVNHLVGLMHSEDNNFCIWTCSANLAGGLKAVNIGHADVQDGNVRFELICFFHRFLAVRGLTDDSPSASGAQDSPDAVPNEFVVIREEDAKSLYGSSHVRVSSHAS